MKKFKFKNSLKFIRDQREKLDKEYFDNPKAFLKSLQTLKKQFLIEKNKKAA